MFSQAIATVAILRLAMGMDPKNEGRFIQTLAGFISGFIVLLEGAKILGVPLS